MKYICLLSAMAWCLTSCYSVSSETRRPDFAPLDSMINCWVSRNYYPGASIAVADKDTVLFEECYGCYTPDEEVHVASAGKWVAAAVVAAVVDHTELAWNDTIARWLPEFRGDVKAGITLRQLLSHTSGIPAYHPLPKVDVYNRLDSAVTDILSLDTVFTPGTRFQYGGLAMQVAGRMAEVAGDADFEQLFRKYIAGPLGMTHTHFVPVDRAEGHSPMLAGGLCTTLHDYMRFLNMIFHQGMYGQQRILSVESIGEMQANQIGQAHIPVGEYVERALGYRHTGIYGLGEWRELVDEEGEAYQISSPGWTGAYPWINKRDGVYGFFLTHVEGNSAARDNFSPFYHAPQISRVVTEIMHDNN